MDAEATFNAGMKNGMIDVGGSMSSALGLGGGVKTNVGLHAIEGPRLAGVMGMRGTTWLADQVSEASKWLDQVVDEIQKEIDEYFEEKKRRGGFFGYVSRGVDYVGDDLLNLW